MAFCPAPSGDVDYPRCAGVWRFAGGKRPLADNAPLPAVGNTLHRQTKAPTPVLSLSSPSLDIAALASSLTRCTTSDQGTSS